jgi:hypothetical protein
VLAEVQPGEPSIKSGRRLNGDIARRHGQVAKLDRPDVSVLPVLRHRTTVPKAGSGHPHGLPTFRKPQCSESTKGMPDGPHADWLGPGAPAAPTTLFGKYGCLPYVVLIGLPLITCMSGCLGGLMWTQQHTPRLFDLLAHLGSLL